jgi:hypothetical protein
VDIEDALPSRTVGDIDLGLYMDTFDNLPEKDEIKKLEQDFVNSDSEEQV